MNNQRLSYLDIAKGIGIILVVLGHCIPDASMPGGPSDKFLSIMFKLIYSFHMPLFFFIAGIFSLPKLNSLIDFNIIDFIKKRFLRLMVPYFFCRIMLRSI